MQLPMGEVTLQNLVECNDAAFRVISEMLTANRMIRQQGGIATSDHLLKRTLFDTETNCFCYSPAEGENLEIEFVEGDR